MDQKYIFHIIKKLKIEDLEWISGYITKCHPKNNLLNGGYKKIIIENNSKEDLSFRLLKMWIFSQERAYSLTQNTLEKIKIHKNIVWLKEVVNYEITLNNDNFETDPSKENSSFDTLESDNDKISTAVKLAYELALGRKCADLEVDIWKNNFSHGLTFHEFLIILSNSQEAIQASHAQKILPEKTDAEFIMHLYEVILGRGCVAKEIEYWENKLSSRNLTRSELLINIFQAKENNNNDNIQNTESEQECSCLLMGTKTTASIKDWNERKQACSIGSETIAPNVNERFKYRFSIQKKTQVLVSAIASLYRGADFIEKFMDNITSQTIFTDFCELIIIDADSPENEFETIKKYLSCHKNIQYLRQSYRIGIYDAWNIGIKAANGSYITNTNLDDLRRHDSLELQAATLENLPFVDVVYQDFYYTFDPDMSFDEVAKMGFKSSLPPITPHSLMEVNSPHNGPMWRKSLHDEVGYFNTQYKSAGDYEFWLRCCAMDKCFYKINDPHVVYYQNPKGISTIPGGRGIIEAKEAHKTYGRVLMSDNMLMGVEEFRRKLALPISAGMTECNRFMITQRALRAAAQKSKYNSN